MQIPILSGTLTDASGDFRTTYPINMVPVPKDHGISKGYLRPAEGIVSFADSTGVSRGGMLWNGEAYYVCGARLLRVKEDGTTVDLGLIEGTDDVSFCFSFDRMGLCGGGKLYYLVGDILTQVTDDDLGTVNDVVWVDGYFVTTDGEFLISTELADPTSVNPLKYGSSEIDPDPVLRLLVNRNEIYAINRHTVEVFTNVGGEFFPFARINGAHMQKGAVGRKAACVYSDAIAFVGSGRNESPAVYMGENAQTVKISTREIDQTLGEYTEAELATVVVESRTTMGHRFLYVHLPDKTLVYDSAATVYLEEPVWFVLTSSLDGFSKYRARHYVWAYNKWLCGDPTASKIGYLANNTSHHYGEQVRWEFGTMIVYAETGGAVFHELELVCLTGRVEFGKNPIITTSYTSDGVTWSQDRTCRVGTSGDRLRRIVWMQQGFMHHWRAQRFRGTSDAFISIARLEIRIEALIR
jgi:hypothetical protein